MEGQERIYNVLTLKKGAIKDTVKKEITGADKNKLVPTDIGIVVNDFLVEYFPSVIDYNFTAKVEKEFDEIAEGKVQWNEQIAAFYKLFTPSWRRRHRCVWNTRRENGYWAQTPRQVNRSR